MKTLSGYGIILRRIDYGEADRIITFLTSEYGKIRVMAKGVRRQKSKMAGGVELFSVSELHFIKGKGDIGTLVSTRLQQHYGAIVKDLSRTELAYQMLKEIDRLVEDQTGEEYFSILNESLAALDDKRIPVLLTELSFTFRVLQEQGHMPNFTTDVRGNKLNPDAAYGYDFETMLFRESDEGQFHKNHIKILRLLAYNSPQSMASVQGVMEFCEELAPLVRNLKAYY